MLAAAGIYVTLRAYAAKIPAAAPASAPSSLSPAERTAALQRVDTLLATEGDDRSWSAAYEAEQLLVTLFDDATLRVELGARALEAKTTLLADPAKWYDEAVKDAVKVNTGSIDDRRALLTRLVNDLQWRYSVNEAKRGFTKVITRDSSGMFVGTLLVFFAVLLALIFLRRWLPTYNAFFLLPIVGLAGAWGAAFSMLTSLRGRLDASGLEDAKLMRSKTTQLARVLIGFGAAFILYFFMISGLLGGGAFPDLAKHAASSVFAADATSGGGLEPPTAKDLALLIVWSVIAGFSERLVPGLLAKTEAKAETAAQRPRPGERVDEGQPAGQDKKGAGSKDDQEKGG